MANSQNSEIYKTHAKNELLSFNQMAQRINNYCSQLQKQLQITMNKSKQLVRLNKTLSLHQHFSFLLKEYKIHRLHELINVAFKAKRSIGYIVNKLVDAIDGIYRPNPSQDDKDLAFLILQFGGPGLLDIVHRAIGFPSTSTAYKMIKGTTQMSSAIDVKTEDIINNIKINDDLPTYNNNNNINLFSRDNNKKYNKIKCNKK